MVFKWSSWRSRYVRSLFMWVGFCIICLHHHYIFQRHAPARYSAWYLPGEFFCEKCVSPRSPKRNISWGNSCEQTHLYSIWVHFGLGIQTFFSQKIFTLWIALTAEDDIVLSKKKKSRFDWAARKWIVIDISAVQN